MPYKHQSKCYRTIKGVRYECYCDLIMTDLENTWAIGEAIKEYKKVKKIKHGDGYYQLFVADKRITSPVS